jgi:hypothetical protein
MLTIPPEVCRPRGGFYLPSLCRCTGCAGVLPAYGWKGSRPDMYLLIKGACRRGCLDGLKKPGRRVNLEELFLRFPSRCAGLGFTEIRGASSRSPGRRSPQLATAIIATQNPPQEPESVPTQSKPTEAPTAPHTGTGRRVPSGFRPLARPSRRCGAHPQPHSVTRHSGRVLRGLLIVSGFCQTAGGTSQLLQPF